ncbi:hypothetical protein J8273_2740 [Carpediemonas membranifera]|uniref:Uncharacterized protein n=1 Tax=Carpediemonas membranifera TaxID=201153 RepID=A0A8J6E3E9_9EUKA|nr:hypothetical protein J8273_2740 [Carpediemonas membranifera]|eukprot:KAG9395828.1 hypothetical protein J8273_2740 [Carpediemonas membranifera]
MNKLLFFALIAVVLATNQFVFPADGDKMVIGRENNLTWTDGHFNLTDTLQLTFEFNSEFIQDLLKDTDMTSAQRTPDTCIPLPEINSIPVDLRIPVETIQDLVDSLNLPIEIDVESIVNNVLQNVDQISESDRNVTISLYQCGAEEPDFQSWVIIDSAKSVFVGALAVLLSVFLLL